jgi:hypothetical protein
VSINIKNKEAEHLLAVLKDVTGKGTSQLILDLLRAEYKRLIRARQEKTETVSRMEEDRVQSALEASRKLQTLWREPLPSGDEQPSTGDDSA